MPQDPDARPAVFALFAQILMHHVAMGNRKQLSMQLDTLHFLAALRGFSHKHMHAKTETCQK